MKKKKLLSQYQFDIKCHQMSILNSCHVDPHFTMMLICVKEHILQILFDTLNSLYQSDSPVPPPLSLSLPPQPPMLWSQGLANES